MSRPGGWDEIALVAAPSHGEFTVLGTEVATAAGEVLFALDSQGRRHLLIPAAEAVAPAPDRRSAGVHLSVRDLETDHGLTAFIDLDCRLPHLNEVFSHLAEEVLSALQADASDAYQTCRRELARWRELIDRGAASVLSSEALAGLFGELWHLRELVRRDPGATDVWVGPLARPHDFAAPGVSLEVKTTLSRDRWSFQIHGIDQLSLPSGGTLYLAAVQVILEADGGETVPELIEGLRALGADMNLLLTRLRGAGYDTRDADHYQTQHFHLSNHRMYLVGESFPKIVRSSFIGGQLPERVSGLSYAIDLSGQPPVPLSDDEAAHVYDLLAAAPS